MGSLTWKRRIRGPGGVIRFFRGFEIFDSGIFWGRKIWQEFFCVGRFKWRFFEDIQNNLIIPAAYVAVLRENVKPNLLVFRVRFLNLTLGNSARDFLGVNFWSRVFWGFWFLPPFEHLRHLKSGVPPGIHGPKMPQKSIWKFSKKCL